MPKKKTGQRKKAEKQKDRQRTIRLAHLERPLGERPCNASMVSYCYGILNIIIVVSKSCKFI